MSLYIKRFFLVFLFTNLVTSIAHGNEVSTEIFAKILSKHLYTSLQDVSMKAWDFSDANGKHADNWGTYLNLHAANVEAIDGARREASTKIEANRKNVLAHLSIPEVSMRIAHLVISEITMNRATDQNTIQFYELLRSAMISAVGDARAFSKHIDKMFGVKVQSWIVHPEDGGNVPSNREQTSEKIAALTANILSGNKPSIRVADLFSETNLCALLMRVKAGR